MKKLLSAVLAALLLLGLLPLTIPPAGMVGSGPILDSNVSAAFVGDTVTWKTFGTIVYTPPLNALFLFYRDGMYYHSQNYSNINYFPPYPSSRSIRAGGLLR